RAVASATSMFEGEIDCAAMWRSFGLAAITALSILSWSRQNRMSAFFTAAINIVLGMIRLSSELTFTLATARRRASALSATGWVTNILGRVAISAATARRRRRRRPRPAN